MLSRETVQARDRFTMADITDGVKRAVAESGIQEGVCIVYTASATSSILITSTDNPAGHGDIMDDLDRLFPDRGSFHFSGSPLEGAGHAKSAVAGTSRDLIITGGDLDLDASEGVFLAAFYGPGEAEYSVKVFG